jgi:hypothetical protein
MQKPEYSSGKEYTSGFAGLAIQFQKGVAKDICFNSSISGSMMNMFNGSNVDLSNGEKKLLLELDFSVLM